MPYIVGERRPELFVPDSAGRIIPNLNGVSGNKLSSGGQTLNLNVTVQGGLATEPAVYRAVVAAIETAVGSGGMKLNIAKGIR